MIRAIMIGLVAIVSTLGGNYASSLFAVAKINVAAPAEVAMDFVKLEPVSVPIIRNGSIGGYVVAQLVLSAAASDVKAAKPALLSYATEAAFRAIFEEKDFDFSALKQTNIVALTDRIAKVANERIGRQVISRVLVENINYVSKSEVRNQQGG